MSAQPQALRALGKQWQIWQHEMVTPIFSLNFTTTPLDSRVTFGRSGDTATRVNEVGFVENVSADTPRFDYDPVTLACKGLLIEETRENVSTYSNDFSDASWLKSASSVSVDQIQSPDGAINADKWIPDGTNTVHNIRKTGLASAAYSASVYAKAGGETVFSIWLRSAAVFAVFNLATGSVTSKSASVVASISASGNGWYRCVAYDPTPGTTVHFYGRTGGVFAGNGTDGVHFYGAQLEAGAFATSYIPTEATAVTRNADVATITGTNFSDFWQASKGGAEVLALPSTVSGIRPLVQYDDGTANNIIALRGNAANPELQIVDGGAPQVQLDAGTIVANTPYSLTGWWQTNDCKARQNSGATVSDYTATIPTVTQARLGSDGTNYLNGHLATVNYYDSFFGQSIYTGRKNKVFASLL